MKLEDFHTHSELCHHAVGTIEDYIKSAIEKHLNCIGISDHFPYEFLENIERLPIGEYAISIDQIGDYLDMGENLREKYKNQVEIRIGFEIDYFNNQEPALNTHLKKIKARLDYIIGSVHVLDFMDGRGAWGFDDGSFRGDYEYYGADKVYLQYYQTEQNMLNSALFDFDIVAHFDLPKKFNDFPNNKEIINDEIMKTLELIKKKGKVMEINTGGLRKDVKEQYPSEDIIRKMYQLDIPILLGSDAHDPKEVAWEFKSLMKLLKRIGFTQLAHFNERKLSFNEI